jgi:hypothetical protein
MFMPPSFLKWCFLSISHPISLCCLCFPAIGLSADSVLQAGEYITEGGWGTLNVTQTGDETFYFSIFAMGGNAHTCELDGHIEGGRNEVSPVEGLEACAVRLEPTANGVKVTRSGCAGMCGARADISGEYLKVRIGCDSVSVAQSRQEFKLLYQRKAFAKAERVLGKVLTNCEKTTGWLDRGEIRNDLAITQYHLRRGKECLKTLEPLTGDAEMTDEKIKTEFPPADAYNYLPIIKATRTNLKLCRQLVKR